MRVNTRFRVGSLYYECGLVRDPKNRFIPWITTWVYMGYVRTPGRSSVSCDRPEPFYFFMEYEPTMARTPRSKWKSAGVYVPTLKQALESKVSWEQLWFYKLPKLVADFTEEQLHKE